MKTWQKMTLAVVAVLGIAAAGTQLTPLNRAFLQSNLDANHFNVTNLAGGVAGSVVAYDTDLGLTPTNVVSVSNVVVINLYSVTNFMDFLTVTNGITNLSLTPNTVVKADAGRQLASIGNGTGALTNDGAGNFGWDTTLIGSGLWTLDPTANIWGEGVIHPTMTTNFSIGTNGDTMSWNGITYRGPDASPLEGQFLFAMTASQLEWTNSIQQITLSNAYITNIFATNIYVSNVYATNISVFQLTNVDFAYITNLTAQNLYVSNGFFTNIVAGNIYASNGYFTNLIAGNIYASNGFFTNLVAQNIYASNGYFTNLTVGTLNVSNITVSGNIAYNTNGCTPAPDFSKGYCLLSTNNAFTFLSPINVDTTKTTVQTTVMLVTNTTAADVAVTAPANCWVMPGSVMHITNTTVFTFFVYPFWGTSVYAMPRN